MLTALSMQISNLARALLPITVNDGELIYRQGEPGETFFIVMTGEVERVRIVTHTNTKTHIHIHMHMHINTRIRTHTSSFPPLHAGFHPPIPHQTFPHLPKSSKSPHARNTILLAPPLLQSRPWRIPPRSSAVHAPHSSSAFSSAN